MPKITWLRFVAWHELLIRLAEGSKPAKQLSLLGDAA